MSERPRFDELTQAEIDRINAQWKSDMEKKMDRLVAFVARNEAFLNMLIAREERSAAFRRAVIDHTLKTVIWSGFIAVGALLWAGMKAEFADFIGLFVKK